MNYIARLTAWTQAVGFLMSLTGFMTAAFIVISGRAKLDPTSEKLAYALLGAWAANLGQQFSFFYQRHRSESNPDLASHPTQPGIPADPTGVKT
jgi:hypothetical protein